MLTPTPPDLPLSASQHRVLPLDTILHGDCLDVLRSLPDASVDAMITDPPAGISFMGKRWDSDHGGRDQWVTAFAAIYRECLRVLKPGGHALVWALPRTSHWTATALEDAGFEVRERIAHITGQGFPKSLNLHGAYEGYGTALKPAVEDWWLVRKPLAASTVAANVLRYGTGALNIGASRVQSESVAKSWTSPRGGIWRTDSDATATLVDNPAGRWPANLLLSHAADCDETHGCSLWCPVRELDAQSGVSRSPKQYTKSQAGYRTQYVGGAVKTPDLQSAEYGDTGGASRYFATFRYQAKASRAERNRGCEALDAKANRINAPRTCEGEKFSPSQNHHPTVKPLALMSWLIGLITPPGGIVLDPFAGSGSTLVAAKQGGWRYIGVEREAEYVAICEARLAAVSEPSLGSATAMEQPKPASKPRRKAAKPPTTQVEPLWEIAQ